VGLTGTFVYLPTAGTVLTAGTRPLSVEFFPNSGNYTRAIKTVSITVTEPTSTLTFTGFFRPVHNMPFVNRTNAGRMIPVKFAVAGLSGAAALQPGSPTSVPVACIAGQTERAVEQDIFSAASGLLSVNGQYTYLWRTSASWAGTCRKLVLTLVDGSTHEALFRFVGDSRASDQGRKQGGKGDGRSAKQDSKHSDDDDARGPAKKPDASRRTSR
jgi:hypothetical protein